MAPKVKQLSTQQMLPTMFQPKTRRHFIVNFDGIDSFLVKKIELPTLRPNKSGKLTSRMPAKLFLYCPVAPSTERQIENAIAKQCKNQLNDCVVSYLDPVGTIVDEWTFTDTKIVSVRFTPPDYNTSDFLECEVLFSFKDIQFSI